MPEDIHWQKYASRFKTFPAHLEHRASTSCIIVCIPVYAEPHLVQTLDSLWSCDLPEVPVEVILLFNGEEQMDEAELKVHKDGWQVCLHWISEHQKEGLTFSPVYVATLPDPKGGVGWARKLVLDEAARRLDQGGVMVCLDGDCTVEQNYLTVISDYFRQHPTCDAVSIYFEHRLDLLDAVAARAMASYELHLRYLVHAMRWAGHPFAYQTVGSSMAVRRKAYLALGGMNTRQAGEDFYFLQKFIEVGSLHEIRGTTVWPSSRISGRVPFGTGRAMKQLLEGSSTWMTAGFEVFVQIRLLFESLDRIRQLCLDKREKGMDSLFESETEFSSALKAFLEAIDFYAECVAIAEHTASVSAFRKRFFRYFNAFRMIRYMHYMRDHDYPDVPVTMAVRELAVRLNMAIPEDSTAEAYLRLLRGMDKKQE